MDTKDVLLVCPACLKKQNFSLDLKQIRALVRRGDMEFHCSFCSGRKPWRLPHPASVADLWYEKLPECKHILLVDDDDLTLQLLERVLGMFEAKIEIAHDGREALQKLTGGDYDLVIMDIHMPGMGGQELFQQIQKGALVPRERLMFLTVDRNEPVRQFLTSTGCSHMYKPIEFQEFAEEVRAMLSAGQPDGADRPEATANE